MYNALRGLQLLQLIEAMVGDLYNSQVGFDGCAKCICLSTGIGDAVEYRSLSNAGNPYNAAFKCHVSLLFVAAKLSKSDEQGHDAGEGHPLFTIFDKPVKPFSLTGVLDTLHVHR